MARVGHVGFRSYYLRITTNPLPDGDWSAFFKELDREVPKIMKVEEPPADGADGADGAEVTEGDGDPEWS